MLAAHSRSRTHAPSAGHTDTRSLTAINQAFATAPAPTLDALAGEHDGEPIGPLWLRGPAPWITRLTGMGGWCGKAFEQPAEGAAQVSGASLVRRNGRTKASIPITARVSASRLDGKPAIVVTYPADARFPWRRVTDELRPLDGRTLLGLTWRIPGGPASGAPFVLRRSHP